MKRLFVLSAATALLSLRPQRTRNAAGPISEVGSDQQDRTIPDQRGRDQHGQDDHRQVSAAEQRRRVDEDRQRQADYSRKLNEQVRAAQARSVELQNQRRAAQFEEHQRYLETLQRQQEQQLRAQATRAYDRDPYYTTAPTYRYRISGTTRETNQYGADLLRRAVNQGYQQGYRTGLADRRDRSPSNYQRAFAYQDANYGYTGNYVAESDYNYYFRQGFQRGYDDAYGNRSQYGTVSNGNPSMLSNILSGILGLTTIR